jgi:hypothetical protein
MLIEREAHLLRREIDGPGFKAFLAELPGQVVEQQDGPVMGSLSGFNDLLNVVRPIQVCFISARLFIWNTTENVYLSSSGRKEQSSLLMRSGSMGQTRSGR